MAKNLFLFIFIFLTACEKPKKQGLLTDSPAPPLIFTRHKSLEKFLDSLVQTSDITYAQTDPLCSADTFALGNNNFRIVKTLGDIRQYYHYYDWEKRGPFENTADSCNSVLQFGSHKWAGHCQLHMEFPENAEFTFNHSKFIYRLGVPMNNCIGRMCRVLSYPVFAITGQDTSLQVFTNVEDVTGLRYGDVNGDKCLDFLVIDSGFSTEILKKLVQRNKELTGLDCSDDQCYKITALTFRDGKWTELKDRNGKPFYFLIWLNEALNPESGFQLLDAYWVD
ncbi:hypothetical protein [Haliscomenobacter sp.]|uniref:hypothetical protein n=1 Tax=Haliscomenobacter sp. TaxID=2717303 RepID=UPI003593789A